MTSSPGPTPIASSTITIASVPLATPTDLFTPRYSAASSWKAQKCGPRMNWPPSRISRKRCSSSGISGAYCALTSISGICDTATAHCSPAIQEIRRRDHDACKDGVSDVFEVVPGLRVGRAERPTAAREAEAEGAAAEEREREELPEGHADDPGRDGDERARERRRQADGNGPVVEAVETALSARELRLGDVEELNAGVADPPADRRTDDVAERPGHGHGDVAPRVRMDGRPEDVDGDAGECAAGERAGVEHDELARDRKHRRDDEQAEHRVHAVVADRLGDRAGEAGERHRSGTLPARDEGGDELGGADGIGCNHVNLVSACECEPARPDAAVPRDRLRSRLKRLADERVDDDPGAGFDRGRDVRGVGEVERRDHGHLRARGEVAGRRHREIAERVVEQHVAFGGRRPVLRVGAGDDEPPEAFGGGLSVPCERVQAGLHTLAWNGQPATEGLWRFVVTGTDAQNRTTTAERDVLLDNTLGNLAVTPSGHLAASSKVTVIATFNLSHPANVTATIETRTGVVVDTLVSKTLQPGAQAIPWNGRIWTGGLAFTGAYQVHVVASNSIGTTELIAPFVARR